MATCENIFHKILKDLELNPLFSEIKTCISKYFNFPEKPLQQKDSEAESWLKWARNRQHLKIISAEIPEGVLPDYSPGHLLDVRVFTHRGPDDDIYDNNKDIRDKVARGNCFLSIHSGENRRTRCVIYALKKFTGGLGDDDDRTSGDDFTWKKYFNKPLDAASLIVATRKANGEAAHLSCLKIDDQYIICAGSKNVHLLFRNKEDVTKYVEPRYKIAREVSETVWEALEDMGEEKKNRLLEFLCVTDYTAIFEILHPDHQHVEEFTHLKKPLLQFITWCSNDLVPTESSSLCSMPPHISIEIARYLGLSTVQYDIIGVSDVDHRMSQIRQGYGYEGEVLYFLDSENNVIGLLKKKTIWYIICRAIREKARGMLGCHTKHVNSFSVTKFIQKMERRLDEIQIWLGLDDGSTQQWKILGGEFLKRCIDQTEAGELNLEDIADKFPVTWNNYLATTEQSDKIESKWRTTNTLDSEQTT